MDRNPARPTGRVGRVCCLRLVVSTVRMCGATGMVALMGNDDLSTERQLWCMGPVGGRLGSTKRRCAVCEKVVSDERVERSGGRSAMAKMQRRQASSKAESRAGNGLHDDERV